MAAPLVLNKVKESSIFTGVDDIVLAGKATGCLAFSELLIDLDTVMYYADDFAGNWESGIGTYNAILNSIRRDTIISSSNADGIVDFPVSKKTITSAMDAKVLQVLLDSLGNNQPWW